MFECGASGDIVYQDNALRATVIGRSEGPESVVCGGPNDMVEKTTELLESK